MLLPTLAAAQRRHSPAPPTHLSPRTPRLPGKHVGSSGQDCGEGDKDQRSHKMESPVSLIGHSMETGDSAKVSRFE
jgi:hypothetical protein